jgi:imidazolonepropionase
VTSTLVSGIGELVTCDGTGPDRLGLRSGAAVVVQDERIAWIGP